MSDPQRFSRLRPWSRCVLRRAVKSFDRVHAERLAAPHLRAVDSSDPGGARSPRLSELLTRARRSRRGRDRRGARRPEAAANEMGRARRPHSQRGSPRSAQSAPPPRDAANQIAGLIAAENTRRRARPSSRADKAEEDLRPRVGPGADVRAVRASARRSARSARRCVPSSAAELAEHRRDRGALGAPRAALRRRPSGPATGPPISRAGVTVAGGGPGERRPRARRPGRGPTSAYEIEKSLVRWGEPAPRSPPAARRVPDDGEAPRAVAAGDPRARRRASAGRPGPVGQRGAVGGPARAAPGRRSARTRLQRGVRG